MRTPARITSFATEQDLRRFKACRQTGKSERECLKVGDNGIGASMLVTCQRHTPMCALPRKEIMAKFGVPSKGWGSKVRVYVFKKTVVCTLADIAPARVCDLNPAALVALGLEPNADISAPGEWEWV